MSKSSCSIYRTVHKVSTHPSPAKKSFRMTTISFPSFSRQNFPAKNLLKNLSLKILSYFIRSKETQIAKHYVHYIFQYIPSLQSIDNFSRPDSAEATEGPRKIPSVFAVDWNHRLPRPRSSSQPELMPVVSAPPISAPMSPVVEHSPSYNDLRNSIYSPYGTPLSLYEQSPAYSDNLRMSEPQFPTVPSSDPGPSGLDSLYPDLSSFNMDNYLPQDYKSTVGRLYDLKSLAQELVFEADKYAADE